MSDKIIVHPSQLHVLSALPFRTTDRDQLRLAGAFAGHSHLPAWEYELNRHYHACGCESGALGLMLGLAAGIIYTQLSHGFGNSHMVIDAATTTVAGAIAGKIYGRIHAHVRLKQTIREIQNEWSREGTRHTGQKGSIQL